MPSLAMYRITPPTDPVEFEKICKDYLAHKYDGEAQIYGRRGQKQKGIDIVVSLKDHSYVCAQCKNVKQVKIDDLDSWILKAEECEISMQEFVILVAIGNDANLQEHICKVTTQRIQEGKIPVSLLFWDDVIHFVKKDQTMLRMYYPEFYHAEEVILAEATQSSEMKYPERIKTDGRLLNLFFDEAVKYSIEEFLTSKPVEGISMELIGYSDTFIYAVKKLLFRAPMLTAEDNYYKIKHFLNSLVEYTGFLPNVTEVFNGVKAIATMKYHTNEESLDQAKAEELRQEALELYQEIKHY